MRGLDPNHKYAFAMASYTANTKMSTMSVSTPELIPLFPLPVSLCKLYLCMVASRVGFSSLVRPVFNGVYQSCVETHQEQKVE